MNSFLGHLPPAGWGAVLLILSALCLWRNVFPRTRTIAAFAGVCLLSGGLFASLLAKAVNMVSGLTDSATGKVFGVAVPGLIVAVLIFELVNDLHKKGTGRPTKKTYFVAIALAACLIAGKSALFPALNQVPHGTQTSVTSVTGG